MTKTLEGDRAAVAVTPHIKVYGERNTGTNYLFRLLKRNFANSLLPGVPPRRIMRLQKKLPGNNLVRDLYFAITFSDNLGWKHTLVPPPETLLGFRRTSNVVFVTVTKNPYSWILSLFKRPYHRPGGKISLEEFIAEPWLTVRRERAPRQYPNPVELWNRKNAAYLRLADSFPVVNLRYEDIVASPEAVVDQISSRLGLPRKAGFKNVLRSTKGESKDFRAYQSYYLEEQWRAKLTPAATRAITERLDRDVLDRFGYQPLS